jgi:hypothetical protein
LEGLPPGWGMTYQAQAKIGPTVLVIFANLLLKGFSIPVGALLFFYARWVLFLFPC